MTELFTEGKVASTAASERVARHHTPSSERLAGCCLDARVSGSVGRLLRRPAVSIRRLNRTPSEIIGKACPAYAYKIQFPVVEPPKKPRMK